MSNKPTWVFVSGIYRSGSTTHYQMCRDIVEQSNNGIGIGYHTENKLKDYDDKNHRYIVCKVFEPLFNGFRDKPSLAKEFFNENRVKAIATIRDPRDVITSMKKRSEGRDKTGDKAEWSFEVTAKENLPVWFQRLDNWIDWGAMVTRYEEMIVNLYRECKRIAEHLEIDIDDDVLKTIAKQYTVPEIQKRKREMKGKKEDSFLPSVPGIVFGTSGAHNTWLTLPEKKMVEESVKWFIEKYDY